MVGISDLLDSDVETSRDVLQEESVLSTAATNTQSEERGTAIKTRRRRRCVTMPPRAKSKVAKPVTGQAVRTNTKRAAATKRKAVEEQINAVADDEGDEIQETQAPTPKQRTVGAVKRLQDGAADAGEHGRDCDMEVDQTPAIMQSNHAPKHGRKAVPKPVSTEYTTISKTKQAGRKTTEDSVSEEPYIYSEGEDDKQVTEEALPRNSSRNKARVGVNNTFRRRAGSASDNERGDPNLRRKLGDVTRKLENVDLRYRNLKEVGLNEASANMDKLRKQCEATTQASSDLIAALKKELSQQALLVQESRKLKKQVQTSELELVELRKTNSTMSVTLSTAQNEIKTLQAKLAAARSSSAAAESHSSRPPGSAVKHHNFARVGPVATAEAAFAAQMKEELYRDLTGLILRGVKRSEEGDTYDCIQTGRNGTLHFKLFVDAEEAKTASFQETEFLYTPLLDAARDADMMEFMPSYLTEEITFAREDASKFYCRVLDTLTKRRVEEI